MVLVSAKVYIYTNNINTQVRQNIISDITNCISPADRGARGRNKVAQYLHLPTLKLH